LIIPSGLPPARDLFRTLLKPWRTLTGMRDVPGILSQFELNHRWLLRFEMERDDGPVHPA
jgi:hypothetical protein